MWKDFDVLTGIKTLENDLSLERDNKKIILIAGLMAMLLWSAVTGHPLSAPSMASAQSTCGTLPSSATASANDGNVPQNAIDNDLSTRWSNFGKGSWIQLDLGTTKVVCSVDIAWFKGNERQSFFVISVSTDGTTFTNVYPNGQSSGTSLNPQPYDFVDTNARYVRITVNGNSQNDWASITEIAVKGYTPTTPPDTTPPSQVTGLGATPTSSSQINLSWTANPAADGVNHYNVYRGTTAGFTPTTPIAQPTTTSYSNTGLTASTTYYYKVAAVDAAGNVGAPSSAVSGTTSSSTPLPDTTPPSQVTGLGATPTSSSQINLSWTANPAGDGVNHYNVYRGTTAGFTPITPIAQPTTTSYSNTGLTASTTYYYKVAAVDAAGNVGAPSSAVSGTTQSSSGPGSDIFGIKKIYSTKSGGEEWYVNMQEPTQDPRFDPQSTITKNADGSWKITSTQVRMSVFTSTGYDQNKIPTYDEKQLASKGYMQAANDWKNIEMTGYVRANSFSTDDNFAWYNRGGKHTDSAPCEGTAYKGDVYYSGKTRFAKEQWHVSYVFTSTDTATSSIKDKWIGFKFIVFNLVQPDGKTAVKMENWLDINNDGTWTKVDENIDSGGWGTEGTECNGSADQIISWGGPITTFRWDSATNTDFKNLSVREIQPP